MLSDQSGRVVDQSWVDNVFSPKFLEQIEEYDGDFGTNPTDMSCVVRMDQTGEATRYYLSKGANANGVDEYTQTPLMMAFLRGFPATVRVLLQAGARVDAVHRSGRRACDFLGKPRHEASLLALGSETDFLECLQQVEEKGCDLINRPVGQEPLLVTASRFGYHKIAKYLLSLGAGYHRLLVSFLCLVFLFCYWLFSLSLIVSLVLNGFGPTRPWVVSRGKRASVDNHVLYCDFYLSI